MKWIMHEDEDEVNLMLFGEKYWVCDYEFKVAIVYQFVNVYVILVFISSKTGCELLYFSRESKTTKHWLID
jgi:hypothetical protein